MSTKPRITVMTGDFISDDLYKRSKVITGSIYKTNGGWCVAPGTVFETDKGEIYIKQGTRSEVENTPIPDFSLGDFQKMIDTQSKLFKMYSNRTEYQVSEEQHLLNTLFSIIEEVTEIKNTLGLKPWKNKKVVNEKELLEEIADLTHFYLQLLCLLGIDFETLYKEYMKKVVKNVLRQIAVEEYASEETLLPALDLLKDILNEKEKTESIPDLSSLIVKLEKEVGMSISNTKEEDPNRKVLLNILDKLTEIKGRYIVERYSKKK